jgi:Tfp pilus assembly protein PilV
MDHPFNFRPIRRRASPARLLLRSRRGQQGFTIIEVTLASFVMAFGIATSIIVMQLGFRSLDVARDSTLASQIMQSEIERLRLWPWSKTTNPVAPATEPVDSILELPASAAVSLTSTFAANATLAAKFTVTRTIATDPADPTRNVRYITISVAWKSYDGLSHTRSFTTLYAKDGLYDYYYTLANPTT